MRRHLPFALSLVAVLGFALVLHAEDAKEVKLTGTLTCGKCQLHETASCQNILVVKDGDKTQSYYLSPNDVSKGAHSKVCHGAKENVTVSGTVEEKEGKKWLTASKIGGL